ncbi:MAG: helix-turn-helix transcriptional regulator [Micrococcales bacterium]|nr:helix-turn-helix transcriptional regulator [Micrococcales bacterium]
MDKIAQAINATGRKHIYLATRLGLTQPAFSDRMRGRTPWTLRDAIGVARELGVSLDDLVGMQDDLPLGFVPTDEGVSA